LAGKGLNIDRNVIFYLPPAPKPHRPAAFSVELLANHRFHQN